MFPGWALTYRIAWIILPLLVVGCSGGDSESPTAAPPAAQATVLWAHGNGLLRSQTDGSRQVTLATVPDGIDTVRVSGTHILYQTPQNPGGVNLVELWSVETDGSDRHRVLHDPTREHNLMDVIGRNSQMVCTPI